MSYWEILDKYTKGAKNIKDKIKTQVAYLQPPTVLDNAPKPTPTDMHLYAQPDLTNAPKPTPTDMHLYAPPPDEPRITYHRPPPIWEQGAQQGYEGLRKVAEGDSEVARLARERSQDYMAGSQAGQLSTAQQQWLSSGVSPETMAALTQQALRSQDITRGDVAKDLAISEAERAERAQRDLITQGSVLQSMDTAKVEAEERERAIASSAATGYISTKLIQDPNYNWRNDQEAIPYLKRMWNAHGSPGSFESWADSVVGGLGTSAEMAAINTMKRMPYYTGALDLGPGVYKDENGKPTKAFYDEVVFPTFAMASSMPGFKIATDKDGNLYLADAITGTPVDSSASGDSSVSSTDGYETFDQKYEGIDLNREAYAAFEEKYGRPPKDEDEWLSWSATDRKWTTDEIESAMYVMGEKYQDIYNLTENGLRQYIEANGKLPTEQQWSKFSKTERVYDVNNNDDVAAAMLAYPNASRERIVQYLKETGGKLVGDIPFDTWNNTTPDPSKVASSAYDPFGADWNVTKYVLADKESPYYKLAVDKITALAREDSSKIPYKIVLENKDVANIIKGAVTFKSTTANLNTLVKPTDDRGWGSNFWYIDGIPPDGKAYVIIDEQLYWVGERKNIDHGGYDHSKYTVTNMSTGKSGELKITNSRAVEFNGQNSATAGKNVTPTGRTI